MPNPKQALDALKAAREAYKAKFTPGFYHGSPSNKIKAFNPQHKPSPQGSSSWDESNTPLGVTFVSPSPKFAESFLPINTRTEYVNPPFKSGATIYPVSVNLGKHFDYENPATHALIEKYADNKILEEMLKKGDWASMENPAFLKLLREQGYDTFATHEGGVKNVGIFNPKNIRGKFAEYNPEHAESADFMKAEGGTINPVKTPREMLFEMAGFPHMADGRQVLKAGTEIKKLVDEAIQKYIRLYKRPPPPEDVKALEAHAASLTQKPTIWTDPVTQARARHELATNPGLMNPEDVRDPFLTQAMTGRGLKGTRQAPFAVDINDPNVQKSIELKQMSGRMDDLVGESGMPSTTPAADALARTATSLENKATEPLIDKLKLAFFQKNKRMPDEDELNVLIAEYNPLRHQYGTIGSSIVASRPKTAKGMQDWRQKARTEGVPETYLEHRAGNYPQYLQAELDIAKGVQPAVRPSADDLIKNPNREYAGGHGVAALSPAEMQAMMIEYGYTPGKFRQQTADMLRAGARRAGQLGHAVASSAPARVAGKVARPTMAALGPAFAAMQAHDVGRRLAAGDYLGAANSTISGTLGGFGGIPGAIASVPFEYLNTMRDEERRKYGYGDPDETNEDYVSVMEGYR